MKKITTLFTAAFLLVASLSFATDPTPVPLRIEKALTADFENISGVEWKTVDNYYKASFILNGQVLGAFYNMDGELVATSRKLSIDQLPLSLQRDLKEILPSFRQEELFEMLSERGTEYYIKLSNGKEVISYQSFGDSWSRY